MVTTGEGKFYSTGVDVATVQSPNPGQFLEVLNQLQQLLARLLTFPMVTVAAINGEE
jgi:enoyl-CoA hydratase/carnithine racemase